MKREKLYNGLPFIKDKEMFKAVQFAISMRRDGTPPAMANYRAANYYGYETNEVAHYTGIYANSRGKTSRKANEKKDILLC
jgi:hypothetical protein